MTKKEKQQFAADVGWFRIFKELIRSKTWAKLSSSATKLYPVIKSFVNHQSGSAFPSLDTLEEFSGLSRASVVKALKELESEGLVIKSTSGRNSHYSIVEQLDVKDEQGQSVASVAFDYTPANVTNALEELKTLLSQGLVSPDGKTNYIRIENLTVNIINGNHGTQLQQYITPEEAIKHMKEIIGKKPIVDNLKTV